MSRHLCSGLGVHVRRLFTGVTASEIVVMLRTIVGNPGRMHVRMCARFDTSGMLRLWVSDKRVVSPRSLNVAVRRAHTVLGTNYRGLPDGSPRLLNSRN